MRLFLGFRAPPELRERLRAAWESVSSQPVGIRPIQEESWHVTIAFLGEIKEHLLLKVESDIAGWMKKAGQFRFQITKLATFPQKNPRMLAAHLATASLTGQSAAIDRLRDLLSVVIPHIDRKPWRPHISIGKTKNSVALPQWSVDVVPIEWSPTELALIKSVPGPSGSIYTTIKTFSNQ